MQSFAEIISLWPPAEFAADHDIDAGLVAVWKHRDTIPADYWEKTIGAAERRGFPGVTFQLLSRLARQKKERRLRRGVAA